MPSLQPDVTVYESEEGEDVPLFHLFLYQTRLNDDLSSDESDHESGHST